MMKISFELTATEDIKRILSTLSSLTIPTIETTTETAAETVTETATETTEKPPKRRKRRTKAEIEAAKKAEKRASQASLEFDEEEEEEEEKPKKKAKKKGKKKKGPTIKDVRKALTAYAKENGRDKAFEELTAFGVESLDNLDESDYQDLLDNLTADEDD